MITLAKRYMEESEWREFQGEAARINVGSSAVRALQQQQQQPAGATPASLASCPPCPACPTAASSGGGSRLSELTGQAIMTDWSVNSTAPLTTTDLYLTPTHNWAALEHTWTYCPTTPLTIPHLDPTPLCDTADFRLEQWYQKQQFVIPPTPGSPIEKPRAPQCVWPPPSEFNFPGKHLQLPAVAGSANDSDSSDNAWARWSNHFVANQYNLTMFNYGYSKNLYHFNAPFYDNEQLTKLNTIARYIPFGTKIRNALDVGAGGGSLSLLLHRRYNIVTLNLVYAELPYCEYITERGGLCAHITAFYSMPFAKFSYDFIHIAWLFHMFSGGDLIGKLMEINRVLRPGGYLWWEGGFSYRQRDDVKAWAASLGYVVVWDESVDRFDKTMFNNEPHQCDYTAVFRKPSRGVVQCGGGGAGGGGGGDAAADDGAGKR